MRRGKKSKHGRPMCEQCRGSSNGHLLKRAPYPLVRNRFFIDPFRFEMRTIQLFDVKPDAPTFGQSKFSTLWIRIACHEQTKAEPIPTAIFLASRTKLLLIVAKHGGSSTPSACPLFAERRRTNRFIAFKRPISHQIARDDRLGHWNTVAWNTRPARENRKERIVVMRRKSDGLVERIKPEARRMQAHGPMFRHIRSRFQFRNRLYFKSRMKNSLASACTR